MQTKPAISSVYAVCSFQMAQEPPTSEIHTIIMESILFITFTTAFFLTRLPCENIDGNPVPITIFKGLPSVFHAFVLSIMCAFTGAYGALLVQHKPKVSRILGYFSLASMASAAALLIWAVTQKDQIMRA